jgi:hypothetical protein
MNVTPCSYWPNESHAIPYPSTLDLKHSPILVQATQGYFREALKKTGLQSIDGALCSQGERKNQIEVAGLVKVGRVFLVVLWN